MTYTTLMYLHLGTVVPAVFVGGWMMFGRKGSGIHRFLGQLYMVLMLVTAVVSLGMEPGLGRSFSDILVLSIYSVCWRFTAFLRGFWRYAGATSANTKSR